MKYGWLDEPVSAWLPGIICLVGILVIFLVTAAHEMGKTALTLRDMRREAIARGYAEWVVDADEKPVFKWKEIK